MKNMVEWAKDSWLSAIDESYLQQILQQSQGSEAGPQRWGAVLDTQELQQFCQQSQAPEIVASQAAPSVRAPISSNESLALTQLLERYRFEGHLYADLNPLAPPVAEPSWAPDNLSSLNLSVLDKTQRLGCTQIAQWHKRLKEFYCGKLSLEIGHLREEQRLWGYDSYEELAQQPCPDNLCREFFERLAAAEGLERTLASHFPGAKRFSLEGLDSFVILLEQLIKTAATEHGVAEIALGLSHRGRLNIMINTLGKSPKDLFEEFTGQKEFAGDYSGDVKYHQGFSTTLSFDGHDVHVALSFNPSHLEVIGPVIHGSTRARLSKMGVPVLPVIIHGDAALSGQGVVMEMLNMSLTPGYGVGGSVHIVLNNQIGFTTAHASDSRSTRSCTDIAKMLGSPVLHVNADDPIAVWKAALWAARWRAKWHSDVFINLIGYRRQGHNEADDPSVTQPLMYAQIKKKETSTSLWGKELESLGLLSPDKQLALKKWYRQKLEKGEIVAPYYHERPLARFFDWGPFMGKTLPQSTRATGLPLSTLKKLGAQMLGEAKQLSLHPRVQKIMATREQMYNQQKALDWGAAEVLAYASLLHEGFSVRLSGQDSQRGTFFHRHAVLFDTENGAEKNILSNFCESGKKCEIINSLLSEVAVMGFEYGYSMTDPQTLVIWEAQFGDFANGAQVVIDLFLSAGEKKWQRLSALTLLLPHGYEGQGPEHSSGRIERFLQLAAQNNMRIVYPSTPAQMFHLLRSQMKAHHRHPLVVFTPKSLLRLPAATSKLAELSEGGFQEVLVHESYQQPIRRILFCSGKIYYELVEAQKAAKRSDVLIVLLEQLYPFPQDRLKKLLAEYSLVHEAHWVQEEPHNQGAWFFVRPLLEELWGKSVRYTGRAEQAAPAVGSASEHERQQALIIEEAFS